LVSLWPTPTEDVRSKGSLCFSARSWRPAAAFAGSGKRIRLALRDGCAAGIFGTSANSHPPFTQHYGGSLTEASCLLLFFFFTFLLLSQSIIKAANLSCRNFIDVINILSQKIISSNTLRFLLLSLRVKCQVKPNLFNTHTHARTHTDLQWFIALWEKNKQLSAAIPLRQGSNCWEARAVPLRLGYPLVPQQEAE